MYSLLVHRGYGTDNRCGLNKKRPTFSSIVKHFISIALPIVVSLQVPYIHADSLSGNIEGQYRYYTDDPQFDKQHGSSQYAAAFEIEAYIESDSGNDSLTVTPFYRYDEHDDERTHGDIREFVWTHVGSFWETKVGVSKVFWGVTESQHLVDIINQTDFVEALDGEEKLGQPMVMLSLIHDWAGVLDLYVLPGFRERKFPGRVARLRIPIPIPEDVRYETSNGDNHVDLAFRWSNSVGDAEIAISHFSGTSREPSFREDDETGLFYLNYEQMDQTGIEYQIALGEWLWKAEIIRRYGIDSPFLAGVGGFEYTIVGPWDTDIDIGLLYEYHFDERKRDALSPLQNDSFFATRIAFNDAQSTDILAGFIIDNDTQARVFSIEASRRIGNSVKLSIEGSSYSNVKHFDQGEAAENRNFEPFESYRNDDYLELKGAWYF